MSTWRIPSRLRWTMTATGFLLPLAFALILRVLLTPPGPNSQGSTEPVPTCDATRFDNTSCNAGNLCIASECRSLRIDRGASGPCNNYSCRDDQECFGGLCIASDELPIAAPACQESETLLREIQQICGQKALTSCRSEHLVRLTDDGSYERQIYELPDTFTVHFPAGKPKDSNRRFDLNKSVLMEDLRLRLDPLKSANVILVFGRASAHTGHDEGNRRLADRRAELVAELLSTALAEADPKREHQPKVISWSLAAKSALNLRVLQQAIHAAPLAWKGATLANLTDLTKLFAGQLNPNEIPKDQRNDIRDFANQVVFVAPLPCDGTEYFPRPSLPPTMASYLNQRL